MSTSLLVTKMKEAAESADIEVNIEAVSSDNAFSKLDNYDVLLIGPQMRFMKRKFENTLKKTISKFLLILLILLHMGVLMVMVY